MRPLKISSYTLTSPLGEGVEANWQRLQSGKTGLKPCSEYNIHDLNAWVGEVDGISKVTLSERLSEYSCRNNKLAALALEQDTFAHDVNTAIKKYGKHRVAVYMGTSTSGIQQTEMAYEERQQRIETDDTLPDWYSYAKTHNVYSSADFVQQYFELEGIAMAISTACSSSGKVFAAAQRALDADLCDAAIVGGFDSLCNTTLYGFNSLQVVSPDICRPSDVNRSGISIGEAAAFALLEKTPVVSGEIAFLGFGESSDAHHMSTPHPEGKGAQLAMQAALNEADMNIRDIDYINLHGTGTTANDQSESLGVSSLFGDEVPCSSTKGWTGHTLGAAGAIEAIFSILSIKHNWVPFSLNTNEVDPAISVNIIRQSETQPVNAALSNSFGFGGSNCSLIFGEAP